MMKLELEKMARALVRPGKGLLAADESFPTIEKRFKGVGLESTEENRRAYREMLLATPGLAAHISGVILFDETIRQKLGDGTPIPVYLQNEGMFPGIKVDKGTKPLAGFPDETVTQGLDCLRERLEDYGRLGAKFTKWRAVFRIGGNTPSQRGIDSNAEDLARFAALSQETGLVPVVEPEVLMDGTHTLEECGEVTERVLRAVFHALFGHRVAFEGMLLKPNMVVPGKNCPVQHGVGDVAAATLRCLRRTVPAAVPGIVFLSGGQSDVLATQHLNALNTLGNAPWELSFSYGRALQAPALSAWRGQQERVEAGRKALYHRAKCNGLARGGGYFEEVEREAA